MLPRKILSILILLLWFAITNSWAQGPSEDEQMVRSLQVGGRLENLAMKPTWDLYQQLTSCSDPSLQNLQDLRPLCQVVINSNICQEIAPEDRLNCQTLGTEPQVGLWPFLTGCAQSLFKTVKDTLAFVWDLVAWAFEQASSEDARNKTGAQVSSYGQSIKLYLHNEFDKAYEQESAPFRTIKALMSMSEQLASMIYQLVINYLQTEYQELGCLNFSGKSEVVCGLMGNLATSGAFLGLIKQGTKAIKGLSVVQDLANKMKYKKRLQTTNRLQLAAIGKRSELKHVGPEDLGKYLQEIGTKDTVEVVYFPQSMVDNTLAGRNFSSTGHLAIRVDGKLMHINPDGISAAEYESYMRMRMVDYGQTAYGKVLQVSEAEKTAIVKTFSEKDRYNLLVNNCSQKVCTALRDAKIVDINRLLATDPLVVHQLIATIDRPGPSTVYFSAKQMPAITPGNIKLRAGAAAAALGGVSVVGIGGWSIARADIDNSTEEELVTPEVAAAIILQNTIAIGSAAVEQEEKE